jgi:tripartite-type tricarboxylate transporter receptor subunit TctC
VPFKPGTRHDAHRRHALTLAASYAAAATLPARAQQNWPQRSLRILIGTTPGGSPDIIGRMLADKMTGPLGQSISVENNTGGGGGIAAGIVANAPPDGHVMTLLTAGYASGAAVGKFKFEGDKTFGFITMVCRIHSSTWCRRIRRSNRSPTCSRAPRPIPASSAT